MSTITIDIADKRALRTMFSKAGDLSELSTAFALNIVGARAKTQIVRTVAREANVGRGNQRHVRNRVQVYRATLRKMRVKVWHGLAARLRYKEIGENVGAGQGDRGRLMSMPRTRYTGRFREHADGKVTEVTTDLAPAVEEHAERLVLAAYDQHFETQYTRDFQRRLVRKGWRPG